MGFFWLLEIFLLAAHFKNKFIIDKLIKVSGIYYQDLSGIMKNILSRKRDFLGTN